MNHPLTPRRINGIGNVAYPIVIGLDMLYILESPELKAIGWDRCKVGVSAREYSMIRRMGNHRTGSPVDLDVIYLVEEADVAEEQQILKDFASFRRPGTEWLMASAAELIGYIEQVLGFVGVGADVLERYERVRTRDQQLDEGSVPSDGVGASRWDMDDYGCSESANRHWHELHRSVDEPDESAGVKV